MPFAAYLPLIEGVREVVELALASPLAEPPRVVLVSSVSAVRGKSVQYISVDHSTLQCLSQGWSMSSPIPETVILDPRIAVGNGYGESKWAAERIMSDVRRTTVLKTVIARVGQLCGTTTNGCWNANEWFPLIVRSADALHSLPERDEVSIPVEIEPIGHVAIESIVSLVASSGHGRICYSRPAACTGRHGVRTYHASPSNSMVVNHNPACQSTRCAHFAIFRVAAIVAGYIWQHFSQHDNPGSIAGQLFCILGEKG